MTEHSSGDRSPKLLTPGEQELLIGRFMEALEEYRERVEGYIAYDEKLLRAALRRPPFTRHDPALYRDGEGKIWKQSAGDYQGKWQGILVEYIRPAGSRFARYEAVMSPYRPLNEVQTMTASRHAVEEDWTWEELSEEERAQGVPDGASEYKKDLDRNLRAHTMIQTLLSQQDAIKQWLLEYAHQSDRATQQEADDSDAFTARFYPTLKLTPNDVPRPSEVYSALHGTLDALAGHPVIRNSLY